MFQFDLTQEPFTNVELKEQQNKVKEQRKELIKYSCISDVFHSFIFIALYFGQMLSGYAILAAVGLSTVCAIILATATGNKLGRGDILSAIIIALGAASAVVFILYLTMQQPLSGSIIAGFLTGSIILVGATLGRKIKQVMTLAEDLKPIIDDDSAQQELAELCRNTPSFAEYREQAACYLRPQLTYGELKAMREKKCS
jgi:hypothetical protein